MCVYILFTCFFVYVDLYTELRSDASLNSSSSSDDNTVGANQDFLNRCNQLSESGMLLNISFVIHTSREQKCKIP